MKVRKFNLLSALFLCLAFKSYAVPFPPQPQSIPPPVGDPVPIDSQILILFAGAVLLGMFYLLKKPKSKLSGDA
ncbi:hypothetical protein IR010_01895 [Flavobacterium sp. MR2016-29]|uniref:hypothetical protein n=1 Tax=Flavobacterium sp. MR2016-29 TaxID=2783795 RepID=UPI00188D2DA8|nr:hypothetical protein [Flavobacterium sp. MR2016-29]MBF4491275.1 hypothetical protein [Flavobacterium sp. MR2016-29]